MPVGSQRYGEIHQIPGTKRRASGITLKIRRKSDSDYRLRGVTWSDIENQGLVFSRCALDEVKGRAAANVIGLGDLFRGFVQSLCKMVGDGVRKP